MVKLQKVNMIEMTALVFKTTVHQFYTFCDWLSLIYHL